MLAVPDMLPSHIPTEKPLAEGSTREKDKDKDTDKDRDREKEREKEGGQRRSSIASLIDFVSRRSSAAGSVLDFVSRRSSAAGSVLDEAALLQVRRQRQIADEIATFATKAPASRLVQWVQQGAIHDILSEDILALSQVRERYAQFCRLHHVDERALFLINVMNFNNEDEDEAALLLCEEIAAAFVSRSSRDNVGLGVAISNYTINMAKDYIAATKAEVEAMAATEKGLRDTRESRDTRTSDDPDSEEQAERLAESRAKRRVVFEAAYEEVRDYLDANVLPLFKKTDDYQVRGTHDGAS
jgi:hypothetical protein